MSQPLEFGPNERDPLLVPLTKLNQLCELFVDAEKKPKDFLLGVEYETFGHDIKNNRPLQYEGEISITSLFLHLAQKFNYAPVFENSNIVALTNKQATIALEPGGQIEIALKPYASIDQVAEVMRDVCVQITQAARELNIIIFAMGVHPLAERAHMAQVKKQRYVIMKEYMGKLDISGLGLDMMTRSCAIQINLDYKSEQDMAEKLKLAMNLVPYHSLISSNSPFIAGNPSSLSSQRSNIWQKTDKSRTGIPKIIFEKNFGYESWINLALDTPMYFIRRNNTYINLAGASFREFLTSGLLGYKPTVRDFVDHMSTVFTEARLKPYLELRTPDSMPLCYLNAYVAMNWAFFYHAPTLKAATEFFADVTHQELISLFDQVIHIGKQATFRGQKVFTRLEKLLDLACLDTTKNYLAPFKNLVNNNQTLAEWTLSKYANINQTNLLNIAKLLAPLECPGM